MSVNCCGVCVSSVLLLSLCVAKICRHCLHTNRKKVRTAEKVVCSSQGWTHTNNGCVMRYCMGIHFLCSCEWRYSCGEDKALCSVACKRRSSVNSGAWLRRFDDVNGVEKSCVAKSKKGKKSEGKVLYHCNLICVFPKHGIHGSLRC